MPSRKSETQELEKSLLSKKRSEKGLTGRLLFLVNPSFSTRGVCDPGKRSRTTSWSKGLPHRSDILVVTQKLSPGADARRRLGRQGELELFEQQFVISLRVSVAA